MKQKDVKIVFSDHRKGRIGRDLTEREEFILSQKFDSFYKDYMDCYAIGDRTTYDYVFYIDAFEDDGFYYLEIHFKDKFYYLKVDGFGDFISTLKRWEKKVSK